MPYDGGTWMNKGKVPVTLHVDKQVIDRFIELLGNDPITKLDSHLYEVTYPLHNNEWGYNVLLGYGKFVKVMAPPSFVMPFIDYLDRIKNSYVD